MNFWLVIQQSPELCWAPPTNPPFTRAGGRDAPEGGRPVRKYKLYHGGSALITVQGFHQVAKDNQLKSQTVAAEDFRVESVLAELGRPNGHEQGDAKLLVMDPADGAYTKIDVDQLRNASALILVSARGLSM